MCSSYTLCTRWKILVKKGNRGWKIDVGERKESASRVSGLQRWPILRWNLRLDHFFLGWWWWCSNCVPFSLLHPCYQEQLASNPILLNRTKTIKCEQKVKRRTWKEGRKDQVTSIFPFSLSFYLSLPVLSWQWVRSWEPLFGSSDLGVVYCFFPSFPSCSLSISQLLRFSLN